MYLRTVILFFLSAQSCALAQEYANKDYQFALSLPPGRGWSEPQITSARNGDLQKPLELVWIVNDTVTGKRVSIQIMNIKG